MTASTFDPLEAAPRPEAAGLVRTRVEAITEQSRTVAGVDIAHLVTNGDIYRAFLIKSAGIVVFIGACSPTVAGPELL